MISSDHDRGDFAQFSRICRMAGNIASGMMTRGYYYTDAERELIAVISVDVAHRQVVLLRGPREGDVETQLAASKRIAELVELVGAERRKERP